MSGTQEHAFERHARRLGHDPGQLRGGAELVSYPSLPTAAVVRALSAATPEQRRRRQQVFFNPVIELRRSIGQGVHDRVEAAVFADGTIDPADEARGRRHFPFPARILSVRHRDVRPGESWDLSVRGDHWGLDDRDDILSVVNVGSLRLEPGAAVLVRGNLLVLIIQRLICEPGEPGGCQLAILPTPFPVDSSTGPLHGPGGPVGRDGGRGNDGVAASAAPTWLGLRLPGPVVPGAADGGDGGDGTAGGDGARGRTGGASKLAEITIGELVGSLTIVATAGRGGDGGRGGEGGRGGDGGHGADGQRTMQGVLPPGHGGAGGRGGDGGHGGRGGDGGISSNVFVSLPPDQEGRLRVLSHPSPGGLGGRGGAGRRRPGGRPAGRPRPSRAPPPSARSPADVPDVRARTEPQAVTGARGRRRRCSSTSAPSSRCPARRSRRARSGHGTRAAARSSHHPRRRRAVTTIGSWRPTAFRVTAAAGWWRPGRWCTTSTSSGRCWTRGLTAGTPGALPGTVRRDQRARRTGASTAQRLAAHVIGNAGPVGGGQGAVAGAFPMTVNVVAPAPRPADGQLEV